MLFDTGFCFLRDQTRLSISGYYCQPKVNLFLDIPVESWNAVLRFMLWTFSKASRLPQPAIKAGSAEKSSRLSMGMVVRTGGLDQAIPFSWTTNSTVDISMGLRSSLRPVMNILLLQPLRNPSAVEKQSMTVENACGTSIQVR